MKVEPCPVCGEGTLTDKCELLTVSHKGRTGEIKSHFSVCDVCESDQANANQLFENKQAMIAFKESVNKEFVIN